MALPQPPVPLKDHCSIIHQNTLYTFQPDAFQSLELKEGGQWSKLPGGVSTKGSTCVQGVQGGEDSLFIVGGLTKGPQDYSGIQRYSFKTKKWETCSPAANVTKNRVRHGSTFLQDNSSILIYGGSQEGNTLPSSQTFIVSTKSPYDVQSFNSYAPPVINPLMMAWNSSHALMLGGAPENRAVSIFGPTEGWTQLNVRLESGLPDSRSVQTALLMGDDGSKLLEIFDMEQSPNQLSTQSLKSPTDQSKSDSSPSASTSQSSSSSSRTSSPSKKRKRETLADRPAYNSTLAPLQTRQGFSLAQDQQSGLIVASGGNDQDVLCIFNQTGNQWVDAKQLLGVDRSSEAEPTPSQSSSPAPTSAQTPSPSSQSPPTNAPSNNNSNSTHRSLTILGATLGAIFGVAAILILLLLLLRCVRRRQENQHRQRSSDYPMDDKNGMDFADRGADYMREAGGSFGQQHNESGQAAASAAASARAPSSQSKRGFFHKQSGSGGSAKSFFSRGKSPLTTSPPQISEPFVEPQPGERALSSKAVASPDPRTEPRTDEGWSKYWLNSSTNPHESQATYTSASQSDYAGSQSTHPHDSAEVQPLNIRSSQPQPVISPTSGLPLPGLALSHSNHGVVGPEPQSPSTMVSDIDEEEEDGLEHPPSHEGQSSWTPVATSERGSGWEDKRVSSIYADSMIYPHPGERVRIPNFPGVPQQGARRVADGRPTAAEDERGMRSTAARDFGQGGGGFGRTAAEREQQQRELERDLPEVGIRRERERMERERLETGRLQRAEGGGGDMGGAVRTFPRPPEELGPRGRGGRETEDMSWLNLGR
ncbi:MAG: hypothetical protein Q9190_007627 [Brigantiaea leucoxantha]